MLVACRALLHTFPCLEAGVCITAHATANDLQTPELLATPRRGPVPRSTSPGLGAQWALQPPGHSQVLSESPGDSFRSFPEKAINSHFCTMEISTGLRRWGGRKSSPENHASRDRPCSMRAWGHRPHSQPGCSSGSQGRTAAFPPADSSHATMSLTRQSHPGSTAHSQGRSLGSMLTEPTRA